MDTIFMNSGNNKTSDSHRQLLNLADKTNLKTERSDKYVALSSLSICYIWKNIKKHIKTIDWMNQLQYGMKNLKHQWMILYIRYSRLSY